MTKKDYWIIANTFAEAHKRANEDERSVIRDLAIDLSYSLKEDNASFNRMTFLNACVAGSD